jgi:hypothetical protein
MFAVEVVLDDQLKGKAWLRVTHNNNSWSSLPLNSQEEVNSTIEALQAFIGFHPIEAAQHSVQRTGETCADCKLQYTSSCPSLRGERCQYFQPKG